MDYTIKTLTYKGHTVFEKIRTSPFKRIPKLFHKNEACFMYIQQGEFSIRTSDDFIPLQCGDAFLAKCFDYFFETNEEQRQKSVFIDIIGVLMFPEIIEDIFQFDLSISTYKSSYNLKTIEVNRLLENFKDSIDILLDNPDLVDDDLIKVKLKEFVLLISRTEKTASLQDFLASLFHKNQYGFRTTIQKNLYSNLSVSEFAHLCGMSVSTFKRKFNKTYNESPNKYFTDKKLEKAVTLLRSDEQRISEIAYDCGFNTISSFNRAFKKHFGVSPSEFKVN